MKSFNRLLSTNLRMLRNPLVFTIGSLLAAHALLWLISGVVGAGTTFAWFIFITGIGGGAAMIVPFVQSFLIWSEEWKANTNHVLFALPVGPQRILLAKWAAITVLYACNLLVVGILFLGERAWLVPGKIPAISLDIGVLNVLGPIVSILATTLLAFLCFLTAKSLRIKFGALIAVILFILLTNAPSLIAVWLHPEISQSESVNISPWMITVDGHSESALPLLLNAMLGAAYYGINVALLKKRIEI